MKNLIKPHIVSSFILMLSGLVPGVPFYMPLFGLISFALAGIVGVVLLGAQDRDYDATLELIRLEHLKAQELLEQHRGKYTDLETRISKALSENRELAGRLR